MKMEQSVPKRRNTNSRRRVITQKKAYNIQNTAKAWNQVGFSLHDYIDMNGQQNKIFIIFGRKVYKIPATFNLHP